jgi:hypothetical protein
MPDKGVRFGTKVGALLFIKIDKKEDVSSCITQFEPSSHYGEVVVMRYNSIIIIYIHYTINSSLIGCSNIFKSSFKQSHIC